MRDYHPRVTYASLTQPAQMLFLGVSQGDANRARATVLVLLGGASIRAAAAEHRMSKSSLARQTEQARRVLAAALRRRLIRAGDLVQAA